MVEIKEFMFNTPDHLWCIVKGKHFHKPVWGTMLIMVSLLLSYIYADPIFLLPVPLGLVIILIAVIGRKYTHGRYELVFVDEFNPNEYNKNAAFV